MQEIDITPKWYATTTDAIVREARSDILRDVTGYWYGEKSKFGVEYKEHCKAGMHVKIDEDRVVATTSSDAPTFTALCAAMLDRLSADRVQQLAAGRARLMRGEGARTECVMMGGAGPASNLPAVDLKDPITGQSVVEVHCGSESRRFWSSHPGI